MATASTAAVRRGAAVWGSCVCPRAHARSQHAKQVVQCDTFRQKKEKRENELGVQTLGSRRSMAAASDGAAPGEDLASLGYQMVAGPSGSKGDFVLRQLKDPSAGFAWAGQENFDALGKAVFVWCKEQLISLCGLEVLSGYDGAAPYATPGFASRAAPVLVLLTGDVPGGDAGTWSRRLVINNSTATGAMFDYVFGAQQRGWSVVIPDTNGPVTPHRHMQQLWQQLLRPSPFTRLLMVGHSYGGPVAMSLLKSEPEACGRLGAVVTTDGMAWAAAGWDTIEQIDESVPTDEQVAPPQATEHARAHATHTSAS